MATVLLALVVADAHSYASTPYSADGKPMSFHVHRARVLLQGAYDKARWRDPTPATASEKRAWQAHKQAILYPPERFELRQYRVKLADRFERHRELMLNTRCGSPTCNRVLAQAELGLDGSEWGCADYLWSHESGWEETARNPDSGAYGIPQALPPEKMGSVAQGSGWVAALAQIQWGDRYVRGRYGSFCGAQGHFVANDWY